MLRGIWQDYPSLFLNFQDVSPALNGIQTVGHPIDEIDLGWVFLA
jgi:hypothetical protein